MSDQRFTVTQTYNRNKLFLFHFYCTPLSYEKKDGTRPPAIRHGKWLCAMVEKSANSFHLNTLI